MTPENSYLVDYTMCQVSEDCEPYPESASWASPDLDHAARLMREVYERQDDAAAKGARARADILERHSRAASAGVINKRLAAIRRERRARRASGDDGAAVTPAHHGSGDTAIGALEAALPHLARLSVPRLSVEGRSFPRARTALQRAFFRLLRPYWFQQRQFHTELIGTLAQIVQRLRGESYDRDRVDRHLRKLTRELLVSKRELKRFQGHLATRADKAVSHAEAEIERVREIAGQALDEAGRVRALDARVAALEAQLAHLRNTSEAFVDDASSRLGGLTERVDATAALAPEVAALTPTVSALGTRVSAMESSAASFHQSASTHLEALTGVAGRTEAGLQTLNQKLFAVPYISDPARFRDHDAHGRERLGFRSNGTPHDRPFYVGFEDMFRGPETLVRERQRIYLPLLAGCERVVDLGCGRGEMLDLLRGAGIATVGVDSDPYMVAACREKGHEVEEADVLDYLRRQPDGSIPAVFCAQLIEHLTFEQLEELLTLCRSRLRPGGLLIAESVNPHALEAFKTFYTDLTHQRPIFPEVALALTQLAGFESGYVLFPLGNGNLDEDRASRGEYAVVARVV
jgi:SAM-dependent methyltransferase